jgi:hypothetical protein
MRRDDLGGPEYTQGAKTPCVSLAVSNRNPVDNQYQRRVNESNKGKDATKSTKNGRNTNTRRFISALFTIKPTAPRYTNRRSGRFI